MLNAPLNENVMICSIWYNTNLWKYKRQIFPSALSIKDLLPSFAPAPHVPSLTLSFVQKLTAKKFMPILFST